MEHLILALDHGTSGMKVALISISGDVLGWESQSIQLHLTPDGGAEQSPDEWWGAFLACATRLLGRFPEAAPRIRAVCASTQGEGTVPVDKDGQALMNCILWMDMRGAPSLRKHFGDNPLNLLRWVRLKIGRASCRERV